MPGKAFAANLGQAAFPLVPTQTHQQLKASLIEKLKPLYAHVGSPVAAAEKREHGDVELVVCESRGDVTNDQVLKALGATSQATTKESRLSVYAVPASASGTFVQVNVLACDNKDEWDAALFVHSYGDMGLIMGLLTRAHGMSFGQKGLKIHPSQSDATHPSAFLLSSSITNVLRFLGLSKSALDRGFKSQTELFNWIQASRFFVPRVLSETSKLIHVNNVEKRIAYQAFLAYTQSASSSGSVAARPALNPADVIQEALVFFGKKAEYDEIVWKNTVRIACKEKFTGKLVMEWTGLWGKIVKKVMDGVRQSIGDAGLVSSKVEDIKKVTKEVQKRLNAYPEHKK